MAWKLGAPERKEWEALLARLDHLAAVADAAVLAAQVQVDAAVRHANEAVSEYWKAAAVAQARAKAFGAALREELEGREDRWRESERGQAAEAFVDEWESAEADAPEPLVLPPLDGSQCVQHAARLAQLPLEAEQ